MANVVLWKLAMPYIYNYGPYITLGCAQSTMSPSVCYVWSRISKFGPGPYYPYRSGYIVIELFCNQVLTICFSWGLAYFGCGAEWCNVATESNNKFAKLPFNITNYYEPSDWHRFLGWPSMLWLPPLSDITDFIDAAHTYSQPHLPLPVHWPVAPSQPPTPPFPLPNIGDRSPDSVPAQPVADNEGDKLPAKRSRTKFSVDDMIKIARAVGNKNPYLATHGHVATAWQEVHDHIVKLSGCCKGVDPDSIRGKMDGMIQYSAVCIILVCRI